MPKVLNLHLLAGKVPEGAVYVGRAVPRYGLKASKWANPWRIGDEHPAYWHPLAREDTVELYRLAVLALLAAKRVDGTHILGLEELRGKDLACWCHEWDGLGPNSNDCHGDILLELANAP